VRIAFYSRHIRTGRQRLGDLAAAFYQNRIHNVKGPMLDSPFAQPLQNRRLSCPALVPQRVVHVAALFRLSCQCCCPAEVGLVSEHNKKFRLLAIRGVLNHPRRDCKVERVVLNALA
jgi:hypothetical protein